MTQGHKAGAAYKAPTSGNLTQQQPMSILEGIENAGDVAMAATPALVLLQPELIPVAAVVVGAGLVAGLIDTN